MANLGTLLTPDSKSKCGNATPCFADCKDQPLNCSCKSTDQTFTVLSTDGYKLSSADQATLDAACTAGYSSSQQIADGQPVSDPSKCDTPKDPNDPTKLSRVVCYTCNPTPTPPPY